MLHKRGIAFVLIGVTLLVAGCGGSDSASEEATGPATVYEDEGTGSSRIELTASAAQRLDIQTAAVQRNGSGRVVPYSSVLYSPTGETWVYVSPKPLTFVRHRIVVRSIEGDHAYITSGPNIGSKVATVGVAELFGAESGLGQ